MLFPVDHYGLVRRGAALDAAFSDNQLAAAVKGGDLLRLIPRRLRPVISAFGGREGAQRLHRLKSIAVATTGTRGAAPAVGPRVGGGSSWPTASQAGHRVRPCHQSKEVGRFGPRASARSCGDCGRRRTRRGRRHAGDITRAHRGRCRRGGGSFAQALTAFDQALRAGADRDRIAQILAGRRRQGIRNARRALSLASGLSESVGESWSRAQMIERVCREKRREDELRALGVMVVRWTWSVLEEGSLPDLLRPWLGRLDLIPGTGIPA